MKEKCLIQSVLELSSKGDGKMYTASNIKLTNRSTIELIDTRFEEA